NRVCPSYLGQPLKFRLVQRLPTSLCTSCTRRSLSPCPNLNLIHYIM
ncbi:hypothetical protein HMPREF0476_1878, partial [Kingella kingae ATCC 23330]